jgi:uncharacterized protein YlxW (UPF0749 family)
LNDFQGALTALTPSGAGVWVLVAMLAGTLIKGWPKIKAIQVGADDSLRHDLMAEIVRLRAVNDADRVLHDAKVEAVELKNRAVIKDLLERNDRRVRELEAEVRGLRNEIQQLIRSASRPAYAPTTMQTIVDKAYPLPGGLKALRDELDEDGGE